VVQDKTRRERWTRCSYVWRRMSDDPKRRATHSATASISAMMPNVSPHTTKSDSLPAPHPCRKRTELAMSTHGGSSTRAAYPSLQVPATLTLPRQW
jgi:hypothetical protein